MTNPSLKGKKVILTRPLEGIEEFKRKLEFLGAEIISFPLIQLKLKEDLSDLDRAFEELDEYEWVVFNSPAAVRFFFQRAEAFGLKLYFYPNLKFATVGEKTKMTLEQLGYRTNFVPIQYTAKVLAENMPEIEEKKILIPASELTAGDYLEVFQKRGAIPQLIKIYENTAVQYSKEEVEDLIQEEADYLTFTSASSVAAFVNLPSDAKSQMKGVGTVCIGPSTDKEAQRLGVRVDGIAEPHTIEGIIHRIQELEEKVD